MEKNKGAPTGKTRKFWFANIRDKSAVDLLGALSLKGERRLENHPRLKGVPEKLKVEKSDKAQRKRGKIQGNGNTSRSTTGNRQGSNFL